MERLQSYLDLLPALRERIPDIDYVDLRFDERVYVRPQSARPRTAVASPKQTENGSKRSAPQHGAAAERKEFRWLVKSSMSSGSTSARRRCACVVGESLEDGSLNVVGIGVAESRGIKRGVVVNLEAAVDFDQEGDRRSGADGRHRDRLGAPRAFRPHVKGFNSRGVMAVAGKNREITRDDVRRAIDAAKAVALPTGREILHVLPQDFVVDEQDGIGAPEGMTGARLEVNVHVVTGAASSTQNIVACVNRAGVQVVDTVIEQLAAAEAVLTPDEKELGVALVDIGGGTVDLAIYERGHLWHTAVVAVGGDHFTSDIAVGLRTPIPDAEKVKRKSRLRALVDGGRRRHHRSGQRWRPQAAPHGATDPLGDPAAARRRDLPSRLGRD